MSITHTKNSVNSNKNKETYKKALHDLFGEDIFEEPKTEAVPLPQVIEEKDEEAESAYVRPRSIDNNSVIIPEKFIFKDEFKVLLYMAEKYPEEMDLTLYDPVSELSINLFEELFPAVDISRKKENDRGEALQWMLGRVQPC